MLKPVFDIKNYIIGAGEDCNWLVPMLMTDDMRLFIIPTRQRFNITVIMLSLAFVERLFSRLSSQIHEIQRKALEDGHTTSVLLQILWNNYCNPLQIGAFFARKRKLKFMKGHILFIAHPSQVFILIWRWDLWVV